MPDIPKHLLAAPTLGAVRRAHNQDGWCEEAEHLFAITACTEAVRYLLIERLDSIQRFLAAGATPDQAVARLADLIAIWHLS